LSLNKATISKAVTAMAEEGTVTAGLWKKIFLCQRGEEMEMLTSFACFTFRIKWICIRGFV